MDWFIPISKEDVSNRDKCISEEKDCDMICEPTSPSPGVYWKPNRNFEIPIVAIEIMGTPEKSFMESVKGYLSVDVAEAAIWYIREKTA